MNPLRYTLISDGSSDRMLLPVLDWLLLEHSDELFDSQWADLARLPRHPRGLRERVRVGLDLYPCDLLFVHRDAEDKHLSVRVDEIKAAVEEIESPPVVCVVPVRMVEAWFLFNAEALRLAAGNPAGREPLRLPASRRVEGLPDPKDLLFELLRNASGLAGRRLRELNPRTMVYRVASSIEDFSPLRQLSAFQELEKRLVAVLKDQGWN